MNKHQDTSLSNKIAGYSEILAKDPHSTVFVSLCDAYCRTGQFDLALQTAQKGVQVLPWFCPGHVVLGMVQAHLGNFGEALRAFNKALSLDGESLAALKGLAKVYCRKNQPEPARQVLERALQLYPDNVSVRHLLNQLQTPEEDAVPEARGETPIATATIAELFVKQGLLDQGCQVYRDILQAEPENEVIRQKLAKLEQERAGGGQDALPEESVNGAGHSAERREALATLQRWLGGIRQRRQHVP